MASQLNHLYLDPFCCQSVYFVSKLGHIYGTTIQLINGNLTKPKTVYSIPEYSSGLTTLSFADNELAIISDSNTINSSVYLMSTPSRSAFEPWILITRISLTNSEFDLKTPFQMVCSQSTDLYNTSTQIDFILCYVDKRSKDSNESVKNLSESSFVSVLNWFTISGNPNDSNSWSIKRTRRMIGYDWPKYVSFDFNGTFLCLVSEKDFRFVHDSQIPVIESSVECNQRIDDKLLYTYSQTLEEICVTFKLPFDISKDDILIDLKPSKIIVKVKDEIKLEGNLFDLIDANSSVWTLQQQNNYQLLELTLNKSNNGMVWKEFIKGDKNCIEIINQEMVEEIQNKLNPLTNDRQNEANETFNDDVYNPIGLEECDFVESSLTFNRFNGNTHSITHRIDLSGNHWLFMIPTLKSTNADNNELPYFVVRHDVDAIVCSPESSPDIEQFKVTHLATFPAFGYVQASKTNKRFIVSSNDFNFVAIADGLRHVYVYRRPHLLQSGEVRNRKTGKELQTIANQHVINLTDCQSIIGIQATNNSIFVLSSDQIFLIKL
jgi:hypothetical protein